MKAVYKFKAEGDEKGDTQQNESARGERFTTCRAEILQQAIHAVAKAAGEQNYEDDCPDRAWFTIELGS